MPQYQSGTGLRLAFGLVKKNVSRIQAEFQSKRNIMVS